MSGSRSASGASVRDKEERAWPGASTYIDDDGDPGLDLLELRAVDRSQVARGLGA